MCTAISFTNKNHYFGRTLDLDCSYSEEICVVPRKFPIKFRKKEILNSHFAIIGMATVVGNTPLFYDAANEYGLAMAGLNFPHNAHYYTEVNGKDNICQFEFTPWILGKCKNLSEARQLLYNINIVNVPFSDKMPVSPLHWIIADKSGSLVVECMKDGMHIHENPVGVMTNNPPFDYQLFNLNNYRCLKTDNGENTFSNNLELNEYCQGLGGLGLPGDVSSMSRFVRAVFNKENAVCEGDEISCVTQFFHIMGTVEMCKGNCKAANGEYDITVYTSCIDTDKGRYYYTTYGNRQIGCIDMHKTDLESNKFFRFPLQTEQQIRYEN